MHARTHRETVGFIKRTFDSSGSSAEGTVIFASAVNPARGMPAMETSVLANTNSANRESVAKEGPADLGFLTRC